MHVDVRTTPELARQYKVYLFDKEIKNAVAADDVEGWVEIYVVIHNRVTRGQDGKLLTVKAYAPIELKRK